MPQKRWLRNSSAITGLDLGRVQKALGRAQRALGASVPFVKARRSLCGHTPVGENGEREEITDFFCKEGPLLRIFPPAIFV